MNSYGATFFNPSLFTINKRPMKFYLDGYNNHEVNEIARIIEAFGGKLSTPDENTIIFSEPGRPVTMDYCRYHIQCLHDSIVARRFQDLEQYRIPLIKEEFIEPSDHETSMSDHPANASTTTNPYPSLLKPWKIVSVSSYADMHERNRAQSIQQMSENDNVSSCSAAADSESSEFNNNRMVKKKRSSISKEKMRAHSSTLGDKSLEQQQIGALKRKRADGQDYSDSSSEESGLTAKKRRLNAWNQWSEDEERLMIKFIIDNNGIDRSRNLTFWQEMESKHILMNPYRSALSILTHYMKNLRFYVDRYIDDPVMLEEFRKRDENWRRLPPGYTEVEKEKILKYLIENNVISRVRDKEIWVEMEGKIFPEHQRTAGNLQKFFFDHLQHDVAKYIHDPKILAEFNRSRRRKT
ncbi:uncharacterized protein LOC107038834 [Diachasma alloeum]|uniref:uncharacterized protein LOC107038834 n=1 Tax=Diachasma alloeum TaxID=454923 RepID=UPI0007383925|nr:uncharacterized protein LOC107038834 [Diachasma alloeum]